ATGTTAWSATIPLPGSGAVTNTITVTAYDAAGNPDLTPAVLAVTRDTTLPGVTFSTGPFATNASPVVLTGTATDATSSVVSVSWSNAATGGVGTASFTAPDWSAAIPTITGAN